MAANEDNPPFECLWIIAAIFGAIVGLWGLILAICVKGIDGFIPATWEHAYYCGASLALYGGAIWALYTWGHNEKLRRLREIPAMEMDIEFREQLLANHLVLLEIRTIAKNTSVIPIRVDLRALWFTVRRMPLPNSDTLLERTAGDVLLDQQVDTKGISELTLEPMTKTIFTEYFAAEQESLYSITFSIPYEGHEWVWERTQLYYVKSREVSLRSESSRE